MTIYANGESTGYEVVDRWPGGVGWVAHPEETIRRTSHAVRTGDGVWVLDPLDAPGIDDLLAEYGDVVGVAVCFSWHARDAGRIARRYDVPVSIPRWMGRVEDRVDAPVDRFAGTLPGTGFRVRKTTPFPTWQEAILYRDGDGTLVVPESLGTARTFLVGPERLGVSLYRRLVPPRKVLADFDPDPGTGTDQDLDPPDFALDPDRVLVGHGDGVFEDAGRALRVAIDGARRRAPRAVAAHSWTVVRQFVAAARH